MRRWDDRSTPGMERIGGERLGEPASFHPELAPGPGVVRYLFDMMYVDEEWSTRDPAGFTWIAHRLAQRVSAEPAVMSRGWAIHRITVSTELVHGVAWSATQWDVIDQYALDPTFGTFVVDPIGGTVGLRTAMWAHEETQHWVALRLGAAAALQVGGAEHVVEQLAAHLGGEPSWATHPTNGPRSEPDDMLGFLHVAASEGEERSDMWADGSLSIARRTLEPMVIGVHATDDLLVAELPFGDDVSMLSANTTEVAAVGGGLSITLKLPMLARPATVVHAAALNEREIRTGCLAHPLGTWVADEGILYHRTFLPNSTHTNKGDASNLLVSDVLRNAWAGAELIGDTKITAPGRVSRERAKRILGD